MSRAVMINFPFFSRSSLHGICIVMPAESTLEYCSGLSPKCSVPCQIVLRIGSAAALTFRPTKTKRTATHNVFTIRLLSHRPWLSGMDEIGRASLFAREQYPLNGETGDDCWHISFGLLRRRQTFVGR